MYVIKYLNPLDTSMASNTVLRIISALSCQRNPTHSHPAVPIILNKTSYIFGTSSTDLQSTATHTKNTDTHFTYQVASCNGVTLRTAPKLSSNVSIFSSRSCILFCVSLIDPVDYIVGCNETCTLGHVFQSSRTNVCTSTSDSAQYVLQSGSNRSSVWQ